MPIITGTGTKEISNLTAEEREVKISTLLDELNNLSKGERSEKGKPIRRKLRSLGFFLSRGDKLQK